MSAAVSRTGFQNKPLDGNPDLLRTPRDLPWKLGRTTVPAPQIQHANIISTGEVLATVTRTESGGRHADVFLAPSKVGYGIKIPLNSN